jgi:hypothetical protein
MTEGSICLFQRWLQGLFLPCLRIALTFGHQLWLAPCCCSLNEDDRHIRLSEQRAAIRSKIREDCRVAPPPRCIRCLTSKCLFVHFIPLSMLFRRCLLSSFAILFSTIGSYAYPFTFIAQFVIFLWYHEASSLSCLRAHCIEHHAYSGPFPDISSA